MNATNLKKVKPKINKGDLIFYCTFLAWPVLQFCVFYIGVNFNSIIMSFKSAETNKVNFDNFKWVFRFMSGADGQGFPGLLSVTIRGYFITTLISTPLGLLFAYYIYKKHFGWSAFRVILFLPGIISGVVIALIFRWFITSYIPALIPSVGNLFAGEVFSKTAFPMMMFYCIWISFGANVLMYSNKMSAIPVEIIESAHLDGAIGFKEFWYIVMPNTFSTLSVFLVTGIAGLFTNQFGAYDLYQGKSVAEFKSVGYFFFVNVKQLSAELIKNDSVPVLRRYAALGIVLTIITIPLAFTLRWATERFGPSED